MPADLYTSRFMLMMPKSVALAQSFLLGIRWQVSLVLKTELVQNGILKGPLSQNTCPPSSRLLHLCSWHHCPPHHTAQAPNRRSITISSLLTSFLLANCIDSISDSFQISSLLPILTTHTHAGHRHLSTKPIQSISNWSSFLLAYTPIYSWLHSRSDGNVL